MRFPFALAVVVATAVAATAHADVEHARDDIVDIRHGRMPMRTAALGWTADGAFVYRRTVCSIDDLSDIPSCSVMIDVARTRGSETHPVFSTTWEIECVEHPELRNPTCWSIPTAVASRFLTTERALLARLGPLTPGTRVDPALAAGKVVGMRYEDVRTGHRRAAIALARGDSWRGLREIWSAAGDSDRFLRREPMIARVERSPDGTLLALVSHLESAEDDFYWEDDRVDVVASP